MIEKEYCMEDKFIEKELEYFQEYLNHIDKIPPATLRLGDENYYDYKCRKNFFDTVSWRIQFLISKGIITSEQVLKKFEDFIDYNVKRREQEKPTSPEEIQYINEIIKLAIDELQNVFKKHGS